MVVKGTVAEREKYKQDPGLNQSSIKMILEYGIQHFIDHGDELLKEEELYYGEKEWEIIGTGVDTILTMEEGVFENEFFISNFNNKPSGKTLSIVHRVFDNVSATNAKEDISDLNFYKEEIIKACDLDEFFMNRKKDNWQDDSRNVSIVKDAGAYWEELLSAMGRRVLDDDQSTLIKRIADNFKLHPNTKFIFENKTGSDTIFQMPVYFICDGVRCKILLDVVRIDHANRKIYLIDIKTTREYVLQFNKAIKKSRYDIQGSFYQYGVKDPSSSFYEDVERITGVDVRGYMVANFAFAVESKKKVATPLVFPLSTSLMNLAETGNKYLPGWRKGLETYKMWKEHDFMLDNRLSKQNGVVGIDDNFEYTELL